MLCSIQLPKETEKWTIKVSYVCLYSNTCFRLQNGSIRPELDHIFIRLGPAPPTPPSLSSYPTRVMDSLCGSCVLLLRWLVVRPLPPPLLVSLVFYAFRPPAGPVLGAWFCLPPLWVVFGFYLILNLGEVFTVILLAPAWELFFIENHYDNTRSKLHILKLTSLSLFPG